MGIRIKKFNPLTKFSITVVSKNSNGVPHIDVYDDMWFGATFNNTDISFNNNSNGKYPTVQVRISVDDIKNGTAFVEIISETGKTLVTPEMFFEEDNKFKSGFYRSDGTVLYIYDIPSSNKYYVYIMSDILKSRELILNEINHIREGTMLFDENLKSLYKNLEYIGDSVDSISKNTKVTFRKVNDSEFIFVER